MTGAPLVLALTAGMFAAVNPCGFSLLPAYVGFFVSSTDTPMLQRRLLRAIGSAVAVTSGFVMVFAVLGLVFASLVAKIHEDLPWVAFAVGALLVVAGVASLFGRPLSVTMPALKTARGRGPWAMVTYGVVYALASLSCTIGPFLAITATAAAQSPLTGLATYVAYALGMGVIILIIATGAALARPRTTGNLRRLSRYAPRAGGLLMIITGAYAMWYARWQLRVYSGRLATDSVIDTGERLRQTVTGWIEQAGPLRLTVAVVLLAAGMVVGTQRPGRTARRASPAPGNDDR